MTEVVLVGFQDQGNLGMGYLASTLAAHGHTVELLDFREGNDRIRETVLDADPLVVGFSLIFQYYLPGFREMAEDMRAAGVDAHFTIGGHYPSLCHDEVLDAVPELDSVVRFEGELTLLDLVERLGTGSDWREVPGIAYLDASGTLVETEQRMLIRDLDELPPPSRPGEPEHILGIRAAPMLASRGCARRCSFCSIHTFYRTAPGKVVRVRKPALIVEEMRRLHEERGVRIILFQDDDFPLWGKPGRRWVLELVDELDRQGMVGELVWKISCRAEYVEPELFGTLRDAGLFLVYMGLESGTDAGLEVLNKQITKETNAEAIAIMKSLGVLYEYGFMLFDPSSTFDSIRENVGFLRSLVGDGSAGATFCRMLPYGGTPIRDRLREEGRLRGDVTRPDYDFLDPRLNDYHRLLDEAVGGWIHGEGISHQLNWAWNEVTVIERVVGHLDGMARYRRELAALCAASNEELFRFVEETSLAFEAGDDAQLREPGGARVCAQVEEELLRIRNAFVARHQERLLDAIAATRVTGPIVSPQIF
jgi:anaerobic magnesium-protoporphyrin IX monomethyl ester cyclase